MAVYGTGTATLVGGDEPRRIRLGLATHTFFDVLKVRPRLGRAFTPEDDREGAGRVILVGHALWQQHFGADPQIIGWPLTLGEGSADRTYTIIGVLPQNFAFERQSLSRAGEAPEVWIPLGLRVDRERGNHSYEAIARLRPGVSRERAEAETIRLLRGNIDPAQRGARLVPRLEQETASVRLPLLLLMAAVGLLLLIACANVANLMIGESFGREREIAIRSALGAGRFQIVRQLLTESVILALAAGAIGLVLARWGTRLLIAWTPASLPRVEEVGIDARVAGFALLGAVATGIAFGLAPALTLARSALSGVIKQGACGSRASRGYLQSSLVALQISLSFILMVGAALLFQSLIRMAAVDPGFHPENILTLQVSAPSSRYPGPAHQDAFYQEALASLKALPGVLSAGAVNILPFSGGTSSNSIEIEGQAVAPGEQRPEAQRRFVLPSYFETMDIPLRSGRYFEQSDAGAAVAIVSETAARRFWPAVPAVGKRIRWNNRWAEIIGVVGDVRDQGLNAEPQSTFYIMANAGALVLRTVSDPLEMAAAARSAIWSIDRDIPITNVNSMENMVAASMAAERYRTLLLGIFAVIAAVLASVGIYGVAAQAVRSRNREMGIRIALGARPSDLFRLVLRRGLGMAAAGVAAGIIGAVAATQLFKSLLFGIEPIEPWTYALMGIAIVALTLVASFLPARRASRTDPVSSLKTV